MHYVPGTSRVQIRFSSLDESVAADHPVRFIEAFVDKLDLVRLGYREQKLAKEGRPPFHPSVFLKLYLYGYLNGVRSSRRLERECERNIEVLWLLSERKPNYHSIADFRKHNSKALINTFKLFVLFLKDVGLIGGKVLAVDGTKVRAHNSKKNNYNPKKVQRHLDYIDAKTRDYMRLLDQQDALESKERITEVKKKLKQLNDTRLHYELLGEEMEMTGAVQVSTTDPDARALLVQGQVVEVCYNVQTAVDQEHKLVVAAQVINRNDRNALTDISKEAKANTEAEKVTVLSDKGYHNARELDQCQKENIQTICAQQEIVNSNEHGTTKAYLVNQFKYNPKQDTYTCPAGESLRTSGSWHQKTRERDRYRFKKYRTPTCMQCAVKHLCTGRAKGGREIERSEFAGAVEANAKRFKLNYDLYRKRQEINEHIFGTIKRKWGYGYTDLNGLEKVNGEYHLILLVYNLKRSMKILGHDLLLKKLQKLASEIPCKR